VACFLLLFQQEKSVIPATKNGLPAMACISAMQKCIRRGMEREAMEFAVELMHTSKGFFSMVCKRLQIISHEDIDTISQPHIVPFVKVACEQALEWYDPDKLGASRMAIGNAIRMMARAEKSREGDHFAIAVGQGNLIENKVPEIPDWANDGHTLAGKRMGRGIDYFREHSAQLVPQPPKDIYEDEAYRLLALKETGKRKARASKTESAPDLFEDDVLRRHRRR
jgi:replication-associated recombination protein RarA